MNKCPRCGHPVKFHRCGGHLQACDFETAGTFESMCNCTFYIELEAHRKQTNTSNLFSTPRSKALRKSWNAQ